MSKVILEFDGVEEAQDAQDALDGWKWKNSMWKLDQWLRNEVKHNSELSGKTADAYDTVRDKIREILSDDHLNMEN